MPTVRSAALFNAAGIVATPAFAVAATTLKSAWAGLLAGCLHTLTGPDHLAALAPLTVGPARAQNALMGALWGCGHNTGQMLFGLAFVLLKDKLPFDMEIIGQWGQGIVGGTLVIIGIMGWWEARAMARGALTRLARPPVLGTSTTRTRTGPVRHRQGHVRRRAHALALALASTTATPSPTRRPRTRTPSRGSRMNGTPTIRRLMPTSMRRRAPNPIESPPRLPRWTRWKKKPGSGKGRVVPELDVHHGYDPRRLQPDALLLLLPAFALPRLQAVAFLGTFSSAPSWRWGRTPACLGAGTSALQKHNPKAVSLVSGISSAVAVAIGVAFILGAVFGFEIFRTPR